MADTITITRQAALRILARMGVPYLESTIILGGVMGAAEFDGRPYYSPDDVERAGVAFLFDREGE